MQRRRFLTALLPFALAAGSLASVVTRAAAACTHAAGWPLDRLRAFADPTLGKASAVAVGIGLARFDVLCPENFEDGFRAMAAADFAAGRVVRVDGWLLSETEAITHRAVYLAGARRAFAPGP